MDISGLDLNLLRVFDAVYRHASVSRAADELGLSQPAASQSITRLRLLLGDPLFERVHGGVRATPRAERLAEVEALVGKYHMENYTEAFREEFRWATNWKVLAENFMESYHLPVCHSGTIGGLSKLDEMICPPGEAAFNYHTILKNDSLKIALAHPNNTRLEGERRRTTYLLAIYPSLLITLTPGYFWYLTLHPLGVGQVRIGFGGGMSPDYVDDADAQAHFAQLKTLLDDVNVEDKGCTEKVYRGLSSQAAMPGHLSHLERPNFEFAQYIYRRVKGHKS